MFFKGIFHYLKITRLIEIILIKIISNIIKEDEILFY